VATLLDNVINFIPAAGGLGTAAMGLVDASKYFDGGPSAIGFTGIEQALGPFLPAPATPLGVAFGRAEVLATLRANWMNGVAVGDQKAKAKALVHLGLTRGDAARFATAAGVDAGKLASLAAKMADGTQPSQDEINVLGQFDAILSAILDAAYERAEQKYRNACKLLATAVSTVLGVLAGWFLNGQALGYFASSDFPLALLIGLSGAPLSPVAKDLVSSLQAAVSAVGAAKFKR
jgi:hypothetical protein